MLDDNKDPVDPKIESLLNDLGNRRAQLDVKLEDLEKLREDISKLFPVKLDYRSKFILEEKLKTASTFYSTMLNLIQEINKTTISEIEIRRKLSIGSEEKDFDVRKTMEQLEEAGFEIKEKKKLEPEEELEEALEEEPPTLKVIGKK